jgi:TM2 domain-containing membrane protein YozV
MTQDPENPPPSPPYGQPTPPPYGQPGQPGYPVPPPGAYGVSSTTPYGIHPVTGIPYSDKSKLIAGILQILLGGFGIGRFYIGDTKIGVWQIVVTILTCGIGAIWGLIDGIMILVNDNTTDAQGRPLRAG